MKLNPRWFAGVGICAMLAAYQSNAQTVITNTRAEVSFMASLWETDPIQISALANAQYPSIGGGTSTWQYIFPSFGTASDGDIHVNMAVNSSGTGSTSGNSGESPIVPEVINATSSQLTAIDALNASQAIVRGIFRWYSEHTGERKYEIHPATELLKWNGSTFLLTNDYRPNIRFDNGNTTQSILHMTTTFDGSDIMTAAVMAADSTKIVFTYPSPRFNYCIYDGVTLSKLTNDSVSQFFWLKPNLVPTASIRCRIVTNTVGASVAATLVSNQSVTVNALTRCDMLVVSNKIAPLVAGQTGTFTWPVEFITLNVSNAPPKIISVTPSNCLSTAGGQTISIYGSNFVNGVTVTIGGSLASNVTVIVSTNIILTTPANSSGAKNVVVTDTYGQSDTRANALTYAAALSFGGLANATAATEAATLTWAAAAGTSITYKVYQATSSGAENFNVPVLATNALSAFVSPLYPGSNSPIAYYFVVRAMDACGNGESNLVEKSVQPLLDPNKSQVGDGIPNWWKQQYGFSPFDPTIAATDSDGDGWNNLYEFLAGTDPTNTASAFRVTGVAREADDVRVEWMTGVLKTNALQRADTIDGSYIDIFIVTNTSGAVTNYVDVSAATNIPAFYYRARVVP